MAEFYGTIPSTSQAQSLGELGSRGSARAARSGRVAPTATWLCAYIEFGNETNESYQFGGVSSGPSYTTRAQNYALRAKDATDAIDSTGGNPVSACSSRATTAAAAARSGSTACSARCPT